MKRNRVLSRTWIFRLTKMLPMIYFLFAFFLYFSLLSQPYFTDEEEVFFGGYNIIKGHDVYQAFLSQHMPFSYYFAVPVALLGARTVFQFRLGFYVILSTLWEIIYLRNRKCFHPVTLFSVLLIYLSILKTQMMGTTMLADHWQGIGQVIILLELIRYWKEHRISIPCACMVSLGIVLSFGSAFVAAYPLTCYLLGLVALQVSFLRGKKSEPMAQIGFLRKKILLEDGRLVLICLAPFLALMGWYAFSGNLQNALEGMYVVNVTHYAKYIGGLGQNPLAVLWETPVAYGSFLWEKASMLTEDPEGSLQALLLAAGTFAACIWIARESPALGLTAFWATLFSGVRNFDGFHGMAYLAQTAALLALMAGEGVAIWKRKSRKVRIASGLAVCAAGSWMLSGFIMWAGYNLLYPEILRNRVLRCEEQILDLLTNPNEVIFSCDAPVNCLDVMDLELIPKEASGAVYYITFYEMWGERAMTSIQDQPCVVLYDPEESVWGYVFREYAADFDTYIRTHYTRLPQGETIWVSNDFLSEAQSRLKAAGYGSWVVTNVTQVTANVPKKFYSGGLVQGRFTAEAENLTAIRFCAACYHRRSNPKLRLTLRDAETGDTAAEEIITGNEIADTFFSRCPMTAKLIPGREYELTITADAIAGKGDMEFYFTQAGELAMSQEYEEIPSSFRREV